jgi:hypothetical protein
MITRSRAARASHRAQDVLRRRGDIGAVPATALSDVSALAEIILRKNAALASGSLVVPPPAPAAGAAGASGGGRTPQLPELWPPAAPVAAAARAEAAAAAAAGGSGEGLTAELPFLRGAYTGAMAGYLHRNGSRGPGYYADGDVIEIDDADERGAGAGAPQRRAGQLWAPPPRRVYVEDADGCIDLTMDD